MNRELSLLWQSVRRHRGAVLLTIALSLAAAVSETFSIGLLIPFLQTFTGDGGSFFRTGVDWIDTYVLVVDGSTLVRTYHICGLILLATLLRSVLGYASGIWAVRSRVRIVQDLRKRIVDQLQRVALRYFSETRGGDLLNSITTEIGRTTAAVSVLFNVVQQSTLMLMYLALMLWISWPLTLVVAGVFGLLALALTRLMKSIRAEGQGLTNANSDFAHRFTEFVEGMRTIRAYNRQGHERRRLDDAIDTLADATDATFRRSSLVLPVAQAIVGTVLVVLIVVAVQFFVLPGHLDIAFLLGFLLALFRLMPTFHNLNAQRGVWASNRAGMSKVAELLDDSTKPYLPNGTRPAQPLRRGITFDGVDFSYDGEQTVLHDISIHLPAGQMVALVGGSGAGKSTLADLIPRFYDPTRGAIRADGVDLRALDVHTLRDQIGIVSQKTFVFNDTVAANIGYGNLDASVDEIRQAAAQANALAFVGDMEDGFDTVLGDRGVRLSGGQRQRIAIARAILKNPDILILDEATSSLDSVSEKLVQQSLERLMEGRTVLAIAHRLSTIENADWVIVLEHGRVVEQGTYNDLLRRKGWLWNYHRVQFSTAAA
jgi:subfamily B ATP-binding cassette protein MsbA